MSDDISVVDGVFGKRYVEVLLVAATDSGPVATVYNTFPLNDCPADRWAALDPKAIAAENGAVAALLNGPRYWLMSSIERSAGSRWSTRPSTRDDLATLGSRLALPAGWTYQARTPDTPLRIDTTVRPASVTQDDLADSYSLQA